MLDGPVQGAEKCATLFHHAVEVGLVKEVTLSIAEVLGTKPDQRNRLVRGAAGALVSPGCVVGLGAGHQVRWAWPLPPL